MEATYLGDIELTDETLAHYGVKGMKWRHRKGTTTSAMANDPRYQTGYIVNPGDERARLNRLNPASSRTKTTSTAKKSTSSSGSGGSSGSSKGKSKKAVKDILSRFKLTKGSKGSSASKATKEKAAKKESSGSSAKKETAAKSSTEKKTSSSASTAEKKTTTEQQPKVIYKTQINSDYTKYLERQQQKLNESKLTSEDIKERIKVDDDKKKRKAHGVRKLYTRS